METESRVLEPSVALQEPFLGSLSQFKKPLELVLALAIGLVIWHVPPPASLDERGMHFLATLVTGVVLWISEVFDEFVVGLTLMVSWVLLGIVTPEVALGGFSKSSWLFVVAALGMGAALGKSGLLQRLGTQLLRLLALGSYKTHAFVLFACGLLLTPILPTGKARAVIGVPLSQAICKAAGFADRSNGSAALTLSALIGFSHMSFMFLTGAEQCLIGWNLLPQESRSNFGWLSWFIAALPAGILIFLFVFIAIHFIFLVKAEENTGTDHKTLKPEGENPRQLSQAEWVAVIVLPLTVLGWLTRPLHGIDEAWVAITGLLAFLATGCLDRKSFRSNVDWGLILFFGVINSMAIVSSDLRLDRWVADLVTPVLSRNSFGPTGFLVAVVAFVVFARLFLRKACVVVIFALALMPLGQDLGIHPGVVLLTILMGNECMLLAYQDGPYQIAYSSTDGLAFSHWQARKILGAKMVSTVFAVAVSVPYWRLLGLIS